MKNSYIVFFLLFSIGVSCTTIKLDKQSSQESQSKTLKSSKVSSPDNSQIGVNDLIDIRVYGFKELSGVYQVTPEGKIIFPFIEDVVVEGLSTYQLAKKLALKLSDGYVKNPQVTVMVKDIKSRQIFVLGQVKKSGKFPLFQRMNIVEAITMAGGFTPLANRKDVVVTRTIKNGEKKFVINVDKVVEGKLTNFYLSPGDIVFVPERFF